jgi:hypothetical protein
MPLEGSLIVVIEFLASACSKVIQSLSQSVTGHEMSGDGMRDVTVVVEK